MNHEKKIIATREATTRLEDAISSECAKAVPRTYVIHSTIYHRAMGHYKIYLMETHSHPNVSRIPNKALDYITSLLTTRITLLNSTLISNHE